MAKSDQPRACQPNKITAENGRTARSGTALANIDKIQSCGQSHAKGTWGGARNNGKKPRWNLSLQNCLDLIAAGDFAEVSGLRFNRHWTVHYEKAGIAEHDATRFIGHLLKLAGDYARRHGGQLAAIWVREGGEGKGGHVHILIHLSPGLTLKGRTRRWVRLAGGWCIAKVSRVCPIGGRVAAADANSEHYRHNASVVRKYVLKNAEDSAAEILGLTLKGQSGLVVGKRCGWTQNIGRTGQRGNQVGQSKRNTVAAKLLEDGILGCSTCV